MAAPSRSRFSGSGPPCQFGYTLSGVPDARRGNRISQGSDGRCRGDPICHGRGECFPARIRVR
jgi:hypothetical protein